ncbi:MAG: hypothetical protein LRZ84_14440 [Desertifilum sp.]|nr:hypothetical protein [Desertifilum sp.]
MTPTQILDEFRQIQAFEYESKTGKPFKDEEEEILYDDRFEEWKKGLGIPDERSE